MKRSNKKTVHVATMLIALLVASLACDLPVEFAAQGENLGATETMQALATRVAGTLAPAGGAEESSGDAESDSAEDDSSEPSATPTSSATPMQGAPIVHVSVDTNCRFGPGDIYEYQGALMVGEEAEVVGKLADESFWYIENPDPPPPYCWIWGVYAQVEGDTSGLPILTPPPTPTPEYTPTPELYTVSGIVFRDKNENGLLDSSEGGLSNFQVHLREDDIGGALVGLEITDSNGQYSFSSIPPGTYWIAVYYGSTMWCMDDVRVNTRPTSYTFELGPNRQFLFGFSCHINLGP